MADPEAEARQLGVRAVAATGRPEVELLLRLLVLCGAAGPETVAECLANLMHAWAEDSLDFVLGYCTHADVVIRESAAIAIGESRLPQAFECLRKRWDDEADPALRRTLLLPIALVRDWSGR